MWLKCKTELPLSPILTVVHRPFVERTRNAKTFVTFISRKDKGPGLSWKIYPWMHGSVSLKLVGVNTDKMHATHDPLENERRNMGILDFYSAVGK